jgi:SAM-dependent methyltransferase
MKALTAADLDQITKTTLAHYDANAASFWEGTKDHDVRQNYEALLGALPQRKPLALLDFGCGPGRDLAYFKSIGHEPTGLDGSAEFCRMAEAATGCPVLHQNFLQLKLPQAHFDGVFANASLFHVPRQELSRVLTELRKALKAGGILFSSNPRGDGEGWAGDRYGTYLELEPYEAHLKEAGLELLRHYYRPAGRPRAEQPWLAVVARSRS